MNTEYFHIVHLNDYDDTQVAAFLDDTSDEQGMVDYLAKWDYGSESEHTPQTLASHGSADSVFITGGDSPAMHGEYILSYNTELGYVSLDRIHLSFED